MIIAIMITTIKNLLSSNDSDHDNCQHHHDNYHHNQDNCQHHHDNCQHHQDNCHHHHDNCDHNQDDEKKNLLGSNNSDCSALFFNSTPRLLQLVTDYNYIDYTDYIDNIDYIDYIDYNDNGCN